MNKKPYIKPATTLCHFYAAENIAEEIINTSTATVIGGGESGGDLNGKEGYLVDDELDENEKDLGYSPFQSLWDEESLAK